MKIELLAPAKDLSKGKVAVDFGADAVYVGGEHFSLRKRASNFTLEQIKELVEYAHLKNVKVYVTVNIIFHDEDFLGIKEYLISLNQIGVDAIIVSSLGILTLSKTVAPNMEAHISTQLSSNNSGAVNFFASLGADRVVLARESSIHEIKTIASKVDTPLEVFIHGGMCSNYSGRCTLSNRMTNRDANRGGCAHSCRWKYRVYEGSTPIYRDDCLFSMSSKDLRASAYIEDLIKSNVASLKIEGRMKSEYYIAQVVKTYRKMIDEIYQCGSLSQERVAYYDEELSKAENRPSDDGFLSGDCDNSKHLYGINGEGVTHDYVAIVKDYDNERNVAQIEVKNRFEIDDELEVFGPTIDNKVFINKTMFNADYKFEKLANKPTEIMYIRLPFKVNEGDMIRKVHRQ